MTNTDLWDSLKTPPASALRPILGGRLKGKTDIDPMWRWLALTQAFGPCGEGWRYEVVEHWTAEGAGGEVFAFVAVDLYYRHGNADGIIWAGPVRGLGGSKLVIRESDGLYNNDEAFKMATTDALGTAAKMIGLAADVYMGNLDGSKYGLAGPVAVPAVPGATQEQPVAHTGRSHHVPSVAAPGVVPGLPGTDWKGFEPANPDNPSCPVCKGPMWDNREPERGGQSTRPKRTPSAPDFKCKSKACVGVFWPAKANKGRPPGGRPSPPPEQWPDATAVPDEVY